jgi:hypothetical protein
MWVLYTLTIHCSFWEAFCDLNVVKPLMTFDAKQQCEQAITEIRKTQSGSTLFCVERKSTSPGDQAR